MLDTSYHFWIFVRMLQFLWIKQHYNCATWWIACYNRFLIASINIRKLHRCQLDVSHMPTLGINCQHWILYISEHSFHWKRNVISDLITRPERPRKETADTNRISLISFSNWIYLDYRTMYPRRLIYSSRPLISDKIHLILNGG